VPFDACSAQNMFKSEEHIKKMAAQNKATQKSIISIFKYFNCVKYQGTLKQALFKQEIHS